MNLLKRLAYLLAISFVLAFALSCSEDDDSNDPSDNNSYKTPKYIFFFIGDGMASPQLQLTEAALSDPDFKSAKLQSVGLGTLNMSQFPVAGMCNTYAEDRYITGSAASATALATGYKTTIGTIAMDGNHSQNYTTMAEMARDKGMRVGIVSSVSIDHATPACFYAHETTRGNYNSIAAQMATSNFDYFAGGYAKGDFQKYRDRADNPKDIQQEMSNAGYTITTNRSELDAAQNGDKVWAYTDYDGSGALNYELIRNTNEVSLAEFTQKGIELLDNDKGFFMMVEGGKIDWACHANDAVSAAFDVIAFDEAIGKAMEFYNQHPDETLIVITGDHECGGLTLGYANTGYETAFEILKNQHKSYDLFTATVYGWADAGNVTFDEAMVEVKDFFGLGDDSADEKLALSDYEMQLLENAFNKSMSGEAVKDEYESQLYGYYDPFTVTITHILNNKAGLDWTSYSHTGVPVPVFAMGQGASLFNGYYDNTDIAKKIIEIGKLKD